MARKRGLARGPSHWRVVMSPESPPVSPIVRLRGEKDGVAYLCWALSAAEVAEAGGPWVVSHPALTSKTLLEETLPMTLVLVSRSA